MTNKNSKQGTLDSGIFSRKTLLAVAATAGLVGAFWQPADAAILCVNPSDTAHCYGTIQNAVTAAASGDTITVAPGVYHEDVTIDKPISLLGASGGTSIIDAGGQPNGINVDGMDNPGLKSVVISGFTIRNANYEGIVVTNASGITIRHNVVHLNNLSLDPSGPACPGIPSWETGESFDCGEGIHLSGVDHSTVTDNSVAYNAGGILLSDDAGATHDDLVSGNSVHDNPYDCGITLASHPAALVTGSTAPLGVYHNTIANNASYRNGLATHSGAGVGIFASVPGAQSYSNTVIHNRLFDNGHPGVALHSHTPNQNISDNMIVNNYIAGNGSDTEDAATPGTTGINVFGVSAATGILISHNMITNEDVGIAVNTPAPVQAHLNNLLASQFGVDNLGQGTVDATQNWWGNCGLSKWGCSSIAGTGIAVTPTLTRAMK